MLADWVRCIQKNPINDSKPPRECLVLFEDGAFAGQVRLTAPEKYHYLHMEKRREGLYLEDFTCNALAIVDYSHVGASIEADSNGAIEVHHVCVQGK